MGVKGTERDPEAFLVQVYHKPYLLPRRKECALFWFRNCTIFLLFLKILKCVIYNLCCILFDQIIAIRFFLLQYNPVLFFFFLRKVKYLSTNKVKNHRITFWYIYLAVDNLNRPRPSKVESIINNLPKQKATGLDGFTGEFHPTFRGLRLYPFPTSQEARSRGNTS